MRKRLWDKLRKDKPLLVIGSPMCTDWSSMMCLNWPKMKEEEIAARMKAARMHLKFCTQVYRYQADSSRHVLHEHPSAARSWKEPTMKKLTRMQDNMVAKADRCQYGRLVEDAPGKALAKKPNNFSLHCATAKENVRRSAIGC